MVHRARGKADAGHRHRGQQRQSTPHGAIRRPSDPPSKPSGMASPATLLSTQTGSPSPDPGRICVISRTLTAPRSSRSPTLTGGSAKVVVAEVPAESRRYGHISATAQPTCGEYRCDEEPADSSCRTPRSLAPVLMHGLAVTITNILADQRACATMAPRVTWSAHTSVPITAPQTRSSRSVLRKVLIQLTFRPGR